jgi:hypothetical protein
MISTRELAFDYVSSMILTPSLPWVMLRLTVPCLCLCASRDALVHVFACDHTEEGIILVCGESVGTPGSGECVTDRLLPHDLPIPPLPAAFNAGRMTVSDFRYTRLADRGEGNRVAFEHPSASLHVRNICV